MWRLLVRAVQFLLFERLAGLAGVGAVHGGGLHHRQRCRCPQRQVEQRGSPQRHMAQGRYDGGGRGIGLNILIGMMLSNNSDRPIAI